MKTPPLTAETERRIEMLFAPADREIVREILVEECGNNLPMLGDLGSVEMDRFRFAALKLSGGNVRKLREAIRLAKIDWRDLLMAAGFGSDVHAHRSWLPEQA